MHGSEVSAIGFCVIHLGPSSPLDSCHAGFVLKNVTVSLEEEDLGWVRDQAFQKGISVAQWFEQTVAEKRGCRRGPEYWAAFEQWKKLPAIPGLDAANRPSREELHDRGRKD